MQLYTKHSRIQEAKEWKEKVSAQKQKAQEEKEERKAKAEALKFTKVQVPPRIFPKVTPPDEGYWVGVVEESVDNFTNTWVCCPGERERFGRRVRGGVLRHGHAGGPAAAGVRDVAVLPG